MVSTTIWVISNPGLQTQMSSWLLDSSTSSEVTCCPVSSLSVSDTTIYPVIQARNWGHYHVSHLSHANSCWGMQLAYIFLQLDGAMWLYPGPYNLNIGYVSKVRVNLVENFPTWPAFSFPTCQLDGENFRSLEQSHSNKEHGSQKDSVELCKSTDLHCTMTWGWGSWKWALRGGQDLLWPQLLPHWIYHCICAKTTFPMDCSQPRTKCGECRNSDPFLQDMGFLQQVTLTHGISTDLAESFLKLHWSPGISLPKLLSLLLLKEQA